MPEPAPPTWPASELDDPRELLGVVGSFWLGTYQGGDLVESQLRARTFLERQTRQDISELAGALSRYQLPPLHTDLWYRLTLLESQRNQALAGMARFDGTYAFDGTLTWDEPITRALPLWEAPPQFFDVDVIVNQVHDAGLCWVRGLDFGIKGGAIWFREDPFANPLLTRRDVLADNAVVDRECDLWLFNSRWDREDFFTQYGYVLGLRGGYPQNYKDLINGCYDSLVRGSTRRCLELIFAACCDVPLARATETVQQVAPTAGAVWVITDQNAYSFQPGSTVLVKAGDSLRPGDPITDTLLIANFGGGQIPAGVRALAVGPGLLAPQRYFQDLVFENREVPLQVEPDVQGFTRVSFALGGLPGDVDLFWDDVHALGVARGFTIAMLLDTRPPGSRDGNPGPLALPATINPLGFLAQHVFRANACLVTLRSSLFGPNALGLSRSVILRRLIPPGEVCIVLSELEYAADTVIMEGPVGTGPGGTEAVSVYLGEAFSESLDPTTMTTETVTAYQVGGRCA